MTKERPTIHQRMSGARKCIICAHLLFLTFMVCENGASGFSVARSAFLSTQRNGRNARAKDIDMPCLKLQRRETTKIFAINRNNPEGTGGKAEFSGVDSNGGFTNVLDYILSLIASDVGSIALGLIGLVLAVGHRMGAMDSLSSETLGQETRSDLLAVFASGAVLLNGISKLDVTSALAESVQLEGTTLKSPVFQGPVHNERDIEWALESALVATPAKSAVLVRNEGGVWSITALAGVVPADPEMQKSVPLKSTPILDRFRTDSSKETYLPTLQALPGRAEFTYLPPNTQGALILPVPITRDDGVTVLVLGSDTAKSFTPRDVAWCQVLATRIGSFLGAE